MRASIIICTRNRAERLRETLESLHAVLPPNDPDIEIVIVDNGSTDATPDVIAWLASVRPNVKGIREPKPGKSHALNRGGQESTGDILIWLDDDVVPLPGWYPGLIEPILRDEADFVVGKIIIPPYLLRDWMTPELRERCGEIPAVSGNTFPVGGNTALTRAFYNKSGGHDPFLGPGVREFGNGEDTLFSNIIAEMGARIGYAGDGQVEHHFGADRLQRGEWLKLAGSQGRSLAYIAHHWDHLKTPLPLLRQFRKQAQLFFWRLSHRPNLDPASEGVSGDELSLVVQINFFKQFRIEARKTPNYEKRHDTHLRPGLVS